MGYHLLKGKHTFEPVIVINYVYIINVIEVFRLMSHLLKAVGHRQIFVYLDELGAHHTARCILVILQKVDNVSRLLHILYILDNLLAFLLIQLLDKVYSVIGVKQINEMADLLRIHTFKEFLTILLVKLHEHISFLLLIVYQIESPFSLFQTKTLEKLRDIGGMKLGKRPARPHLISILNHLFDDFYIFFS